MPIINYLSLRRAVREKELSWIADYLQYPNQLSTLGCNEKKILKYLEYSSLER